MHSRERSLTMCYMGVDNICMGHEEFCHNFLEPSKNHVDFVRL